MVRDCYACAPPLQDKYQGYQWKAMDNLFAITFLRPTEKNSKSYTRMAYTFGSRFEIRSERMRNQATQCCRDFF